MYDGNYKVYVAVLQSTTMIDFYKGGDDHDQSDDVGKPSDFNLRLK